MSSKPTYYERRYRTLFGPKALDFAARLPRPAAGSAIYSPAPTGIHCGLPKAARITRDPRVLLPFLLPIVLATGIVTYMELRTQQGDRSETLERLDQVMEMYEDTQ